MRESRLGRWVARISVTLGLGAAVFGGVAVLSVASAGATPVPATSSPAADTSFGSTSPFTVNQPVGYQIPEDSVWW